MSERTQTERASTFTPVRAGQTSLLQRKCACGGSAGLTGECAACDRERLTLQRHSIGQSSPSTAPPVVDEVLRSTGHPLDAQARNLMELHFGHDFSLVRVHADGQAAESARAVNASAYTVGQQVVFGSGKYQPQTMEGRRLLAHELTHVVQQTGVIGLAKSGGSGSQFSGAATEAEADRNAEAIDDSRPAAVQLKAGAGDIQRQPAVRDEETEKILGAAGRAQRAPHDQTGMFIRGSEITYRLIGKYLPVYKSKISGVGYDETVKGVKAAKSGKNSISVTVGRDFILSTDLATLKMHTAQIEQALKSSGVAPEIAAPDKAAGQTEQPAKADEAAKPDAAAQPAQVAEQGKWSYVYKTPKTKIGVPYEEYKAGIGELRATTEGGIKGAPGRGTKAAPTIEFDVLKKAFPGMAKDVAADPKREEKAREYLKSLNLAFKIMKIDTVEAQANYLSHAFVESDQFRQFIETQGWLNAAKDPAKRADQKWITDRQKLRLDDKYLKDTYNPTIPKDKMESKEPEWVEARRRKASVNPFGQFEFLGRGPVQVTHNYNYVEVVAMLELTVEHYQKEAEQPGADASKKTEALNNAAFAREAANEIKADPGKAADPKYTFLFSAAYMKKKRADVNVADSVKNEWTGGDPKSRWVAGDVQTQDAQVAALKDKQGAYKRILPLLMCEAKKAGVAVDPEYSC